MKVIWASLHRPDPHRGGGWSHAFHLLAEAGKRHDVTLVTSVVSPGDDDLTSLGVRIVAVPCRRRSPPRNRAALLARAVAGPGTIGFWQVAPCVEALTRQVLDLESHERFDVVSVFAGEMAPMVRRTRAPTALLLTDSYARQGPREVAHAENRRHRLMHRLEAMHALRWERTRYPAAGTLACTSAEDAAEVRRLTRRPDVAVIPPPIAPEFFAPPDRPRRLEQVAFIGALDYRPNVDGLRWFLETSWPIITARRPGATLRVVGRNAVPEARSLIERAGVEFYPDVPDIRPYYWEAGVVVIPLRLGSGVKNKTLHAIATSTPLVGSPVAFEGIPVSNGEHALIGADSAALADAVIETMAAPEAAAARAARARPIADRYRRERVADLLDALWNETAALPRKG